jgi:hypothetical protein
MKSCCPSLLRVSCCFPLNFWKGIPKVSCSCWVRTTLHYCVKVTFAGWVLFWRVPVGGQGAYMRVARWAALKAGCAAG